MKDLLSKEHYCYKIHTLMKGSAYPPFPPVLAPLYGLPPPFLQENLDPPSNTPINKGGGHTMVPCVKVL